MKDDYAFPRVTKLGEQAPGMELRDWFAGMALAGRLADHTVDMYPHERAIDAYELADKMLAQREKQQR